MDPLSNIKGSWSNKASVNESPAPDTPKKEIIDLLTNGGWSGWAKLRNMIPQGSVIPVLKSILNGDGYDKNNEQDNKNLYLMQTEIIRFLSFANRTGDENVKKEIKKIISNVMDIVKKDSTLKALSEDLLSEMGGAMQANTNNDAMEIHSNNIKRWADNALKDKSVDANEAQELQNIINEDGKVDSNELQDLSNILDNNTISLSPEAQKLLEDALLEQVKKNVYKRLKYNDTEGKFQEKDMVVRRADQKASNGLFELDISAADGKFKNPEALIDIYGNIIIGYSNIFEDQKEYSQNKLPQSNLTESKDESGVYHFYDTRTNKEVSTPEGYSRINARDVLNNKNYFNSPFGLENGEKEKILELLTQKGYILSSVGETTVGIRSFGAADYIDLAVYDTNEKKLKYLKINWNKGNGISFEDLKNGIENPVDLNSASAQKPAVQEQQKQAQYVIPGQQYLHYLPEGAVKVEGNPEILKKYGFEFAAERNPNLPDKVGGEGYKQKTGEIVCKISNADARVFKLQCNKEATDMNNPELNEYTFQKPKKGFEAKFDEAMKTEKIVVEGGTDENGIDFITVKRYFKPEKDGSQKGDIVRVFLYK